MGNNNSIHPAEMSASVRNFHVDMVRKLQDETSFDGVDVEKLYIVFHEVSNGKNSIDREAFQRALGKLEQFGLKRFKDLPLGKRLFDLFDLNKDDSVDLTEFFGGLSILCKGTDDDKIKYTFMAFDSDNDHYITKNELLAIYTATYKSLLLSLKAAVTPGDNNNTKQDPELEQFQNRLIEQMEKNFSSQMHVVADNILNTLDSNKDGRLDIEEFKAFVKKNPFVKASYSVEVGDSPATNPNSLTAAALLSYLIPQTSK